MEEELTPLLGDLDALGRNVGGLEDFEQELEII